MPKIPEWTKKGEDFVKEAEENWERDWGEAYLGIYKEDGLYTVEITSGRDTDIYAEEETLEDAREVAIDYMKRKDKSLLFPQEKNPYDTVLEYLENQYFNYSGRDINGMVANYIHNNYQIFTEYEDYDSGEIERVEAEVSTSNHNERLGLTTSRERGFIKKKSLDSYDVGDIIYRVLEEKDIEIELFYIEVMRNKVQGEPIDLPEEYDFTMTELEEEVTNRIAEHYAKKVVEQFENPPQTEFLPT